MIATLQGEVSEILSNMLVLDVNGVGYGVFVTNEDSSGLKRGTITKLFIYEYVREQAHDLFGFLSRETLMVFEQLIAVNGVGPRMGLNLLSIGPAQDVRRAIAEGNVKYLQQASGVGKRVAERVVVDLKDKVGLIAVDLESTGLLQGENYLMQDEAVEALVSLGYSSAEAAKALGNVDPELPTADRIKIALTGGKK